MPAGEFPQVAFQQNSWGSSKVPGVAPDTPLPMSTEEEYGAVLSPRFVDDLCQSLDSGSGASGVILDVALGQAVDIKSEETAKDVPVLVTVTPPVGSERTPVDLCCVVDISGSMGSPATMKNDDGDEESHGLTLLDIVKHALRTVFHTLGPEDRLSIVAFDNRADMALELTHMDTAGRAKAESAVVGLHTRGGTNIWAGLERAVKVLSRQSEMPTVLTGDSVSDDTRERFGAILLLTDGCPNDHPPEGELKALQKARESNPRGALPATVSTFGFGYNLDSMLLKDLADEGDGVYAFIPDSSFVGTVFVHALSNVLVSAAKEAKLHLEPQNGAQLLDFDGGVADVRRLAGYPASGDTKHAVVRLGALQHGQNRDVVLRMRVPAASLMTDVSADKAPKSYLKASLEYEHVKQAACSADPNALRVSEHGRTMWAHVQADAHTKRAEEVEVQTLRQSMAERIILAMSVLQRNATGEEESKKIITDFIAQVKASSASSHDHVVALLEDLEGQVTEAFSRPDWYSRWGRHYLPSLARAHLLQQCNNFKDPGVQVYGGDIFAKVRDDADDLFVSLPPPVPSRPQAGRGGATCTSISMATYHNASGG